MIVQELLKKCDFDAIARLVCDNKPSYEPPYDLEKVKHAYKKFVDMLLTLKPESSNKIIIFEKHWWDDDEIAETVEAELYEYEDFIAKRKDLLNSPRVEMINYENLPVKDLKEIISNFPQIPQAYAYEFNEWETTLGYNVFEENYSKFNLQECIYSVLHEMSFNGMSKESQIERREELENSAKHLDEILQLPKEEQKKHFVPAEESHKMFGFIDERTEEEKEEALRQLYICSLKTMYWKYNYILECEFVES